MQIDDKKYAELVEKAKHDDKMKEINKKSYQRRNARISIMLEKAKKANITVSEKEVDDYLKK
jgi:hypothetical protein